MAGMLTVVNPRRRRRRARRRATNKRRTHRRRRRVARRHVFANPVHRRRRARRVHHRRRRHHNPAFRMGGIVGTLTKGVALGAGVIGTNLATNGVNKMLGANALTGPAKLALKAAVGLVALPMVLGFVPGGKKFAGSVRLGAGIAIALDIYDQYIKNSLPDYLKDYQYGALSDWAPQAGIAAYHQGSLSGIYDEGTYS